MTKNSFISTSTRSRNQIKSSRTEKIKIVEVNVEDCEAGSVKVRIFPFRQSGKSKVIKTAFVREEEFWKRGQKPANTSYIQVILDLVVPVNEHCCHLIVWRSLFVSSLHFSMATRPPREPRGSRVMLRRCIFLISTSENFVSRYLSPSGLARHIAGIRQPARYEATVFPSGMPLPFKPRRANCSSSYGIFYYNASLVQ